MTITVEDCSMSLCGDSIGPAVNLEVCACFPECSGAPNNYYSIYDLIYEIFTGCDQNHPAVYTYATDTGLVDLIYHYYYDGVLNIFNITSPTIDVQSPLGHISYDYLCSEPHSFLFHSNAIDTDSIFWDFGDSTYIDTGNVLNPSHYYTDTGDYIVVLEMYNYTTGCVLVDSIKVDVRDILAYFEVDSLLCAHVPILFNAETSEDVFTSCYSGYEWDFGDSTPVMSVYSPYAYHKYSQNGTFIVELRVWDINGCIDYHFDTVKVYDISANLDFNPASLCVPDSVHFIDLSWSDTTIVSWEFNPGFGNLLSNVPSVLQYESYVDTFLHINLYIEDALGCNDSWTDSIELNIML